MQVLLRAWPDIHRRTGLRLTVAGADPLAVRLLLARLRVPDDGIDVVGFLSQAELDEDAPRRQGGLSRRPSARRASGWCSRGRVRVRASGRRVDNIPGYREVLTPEVAVSVAPERSDGSLPDAVCALVDDEPRREALGEVAQGARR